MKNLRILLRIEGKIRIGRTRTSTSILLTKLKHRATFIYFRALLLLRIQCQVFKCYVQRNDEYFNNKRKA